MFGIRVVQLEGVQLHGGSPPAGSWVKDYDPDAHEGRGLATWTMDRSEAQRFASQKDAMDFYLQTSKILPERRDGRPNRPLTAYTVSIEPIDE